jgi:hypothetical protein
MSKTAKRLLICACVLLCYSANAFELNGAWTTNPENCSKIFASKNNKIVFANNSDFFGSGFVIEGDQIRGPGKSCKIIKRKEENATLNLIASCSTDIAVLGTQQLSAKIESDNQLVRIYPDFPEMGISFYRCKL